MRLGFVTCVQLGLDVLDEIYTEGHRVDAMVTLKDDVSLSKSGRVFIDEMAARHDSALHKTQDINDPRTIEWLHSQELDWIFIVGWSQIAKPDVLDLPRRGCLGMHPTLLPEGRGRASIPWAIIKGLDKTGVTLFKLDEGIDTGALIDAVEIPVHRLETASSLYMKALEAHRQLIRDNIGRIAADAVSLYPQLASEATYWPGRRPSDGQIRSEQTAAEIERLVRALAPPYPPAWWVDSQGREWNILAGTTDLSVPGLRISGQDAPYIATVFDVRT